MKEAIEWLFTFFRVLEYKRQGLEHLYESNFETLNNSVPTKIVCCLFYDIHTQALLSCSCTVIELYRESR